MNNFNSVDISDSYGFNQPYYLLNKPVINKNAISKSLYFKEWSFNHLKSKFGTRLVDVSHSKDGYYDFVNKEEYQTLRVPFANAIDYVTSEDQGRYYYLAQSSIATNFPELTAEIELPPGILSTDIVLAQNLWIGGSGCITALHYDFSPNFLVQVRGRKKLTIFSPDENNYLYPRQQAGVNHLSEIDLRAIDLLRFPLFKNEKSYECILNPGDILYIPPGWWHEVRSLDSSISLNYWFVRFDSLKDSESSIKRIREQINYLISLGLSVNGKDYEGEFYLFKAINEAMDNVVEALLISGADSNLKSCKYHKGASAIQFAHKLGYHEIVKLLLKHGAIDNR